MLQLLLSPALLSSLILSLCLATTLALWHSARTDAAQDAQGDFDFRVHELLNNVAQRMQIYVQVLYGVQGLFASSHDVERGEFRAYLAGQDLNQHFPGIHGVGYIALLDDAGRDAYIAMVRAEGYPDFTITPPGRRAAYAASTYLEPFSGSNLRAFGYDLWSEPVRRAALEQARDSGMPAMSGRVRLVQESTALPPEQAGFLVVLPVYRNGAPHATLAERRAALRGWVYAPFRIGDVMSGIGSAYSGKLDVEIYDGAALAPAALMYDTGAAAADGPARRAAVQTIRIAGHRWSVRLSEPLGPLGSRADKPRLIAGAGLLLGVTLAGLAWLLARSRAKARAALRRARVLTAELKEGQTTLVALADSAQRSQAVLRSILDSTIDGILVDNLQGMVLNSNRRFRALWNVPEQLDWQGDGAVLLQHLADQLLQTGPLLQAEARLHADGDEHRALLKLRDGRTVELFTRGLRVGSAPARLWSFRDITERTQIEQREQTRRHVLELLATGAPLQTILEGVVLGVEAGNPDMLCSILLLDEAGTHLLVGAAPSLPAFFNAAIHGLPTAGGLGSCGRAALEGRRVIVDDIATDPSWAPFKELAARARLGSCWSDPIFGATGQVLGTFAIYHHAAHRPSMANIALIEQAAHLAGIAIEQAQAAVALRAGEARFRSLYDHAPVALWEQDWSAVRAALAELELSGVDELGRYLDANPSELTRLAALVRILDVNTAARLQVGAGPGDAAALSLAQNFDAAAMPAFARAVAALAGGELLFACESSFLRLDGVARQNELTLLVMPGHTHSLDFVIVSTVDITERKRMNDELLVLATTDFLTGLPNRRAFTARLDDEQARLQRDVGGCAAVLMLDLDHFKRINDEYGHPTGDAVLRHVAALMRDSQRKIDTLGRVGGEEFAVLLPGTAIDAAALFADRLRQRIAATPLLLDGRSYTVTVSIGIAAMCGADTDADAALIRADQALYRAKRGGRDRVELESAMAQGTLPMP
ncbi:CHASE domain-containing protein [Rugamonas sp.]|uniref:CHASE domain-containing protein n=1 Tax=Rugamonas sp. TaxID=1926287 RepID=UPI0025F7EF03|nr:CHASE domain-containing protein [Rugamonas sp.]